MPKYVNFKSNSKKYYEKRKENNYYNIDVICDCGKLVKKCSLYSHIKSKYHLDNSQNQLQTYVKK